MEKTIFISGPDPKLELVYTDVWLPGIYSRRVFVFEIPPTSSHEKVVGVLEKALQALVDGTPELGSESVIVPASENDRTPWRALGPYKGLELVVKDFTKTLPSYSELEKRGFPMAVFKDRQLMPIPFSIEPEPQPQAKIQVSLIEGGILLSTCFYHHLSDGNGMNNITHALASACKSLSSSSSTLSPISLNLSRQTLRELTTPPITDLSRLPAYMVIPDVYLPGAPHAEEEPPADPSPPPPPNPPKKVIQALFRLPSASAAELKSHSSSLRPVSTHDSISALLFRTLILSRLRLGRLRPSDKATHTFPYNARKYLGLPPDWVGNCVGFGAVEVPASDFLLQGEGESGALPVLAGKMREVLDGVTTELVEGLMGLRRKDPFSLAWWPTGMPTDPKVVIITSFYRSGLLGMDWGEAFGGKARHFTTSDVGAFAGGFERSAFVGPRFEGEEGGKGCDVMVGVDEEELGFFERDEVWNRYFVRLSEEV